VERGAPIWGAYLKDWLDFSQSSRVLEIRYTRRWPDHVEWQSPRHAALRQHHA
jgi:hypothetical protein